MVQITPALLAPWFSRCVGRSTAYALQQADGRYWHVDQPLTYEVAAAHLQGQITVATYPIDEQGFCRFCVYDSDTPDDLTNLNTLQTSLAGVGVVSYPELSRRGWHSWVFLAEPLAPHLLRRWLLPFCPAGVEFYPKQDGLTADRPFGSKIRLPLGVHRLTGLRYPFVELVNGTPVPLAPSLLGMLACFSAFERVPVPVFPAEGLAPVPSAPSTWQSSAASSVQGIREWCLAQDPLAVIGRYVALDAKGTGCCPFGWHHDDGCDRHPSLWVYRPCPPDICCWYCHTWQAGGSLFDFLRYYYALSARELWHRLLSGARF